MIGGLAHSGRVIFAAAAVMVAVFFTFALSGPLPPKEMGVILGIAVLLDAMLVRLVLIPTPAPRIRPLRLGAAPLARPHPPRRPLRPLLLIRVLDRPGLQRTERMNGRVPGLASEVQARPYPSSGHLSGYSIATNGSRLQAHSIARPTIPSPLTWPHDWKRLTLLLDAALRRF